MGTRGSFLGVKRPGRKANHSPSSSAEVQNTWSYASTPQYIFMAWRLVKHRDNFTFLLFTFTCFYFRQQATEIPNGLKKHHEDFSIPFP
jgi:hypothetical protein